MNIKDLSKTILQKIVAAYTYVKDHVVGFFTKKKVDVTPVDPTVLPVAGAESVLVKRGGILSTIVSGAGSFLDTAKVWIFVIMFVLILLLSGGLYFYYNYSQSEISAAVSAEQTAVNSFNTEKDSFVQMQKQNQDLLNQLTALQKKQTATQLQNDALKKKIQSYNYAGAKTNPTQAQTDANNMYGSVLQKLEADTNPATVDPAKKGK